MGKEQIIKALKRERASSISSFELVFFLTMEKYGKVHPYHRNYFQWNQMSNMEKKLHINDMAQIYVDTAQDFGHDAIFVHFVPHTLDVIIPMCERIREIAGDEFFLMMHGDATLEIPSGNDMVEFSALMYEHPEKLIERQERNLKDVEKIAKALSDIGGLMDGFALCSDYAFNTNPFFSPDMFGEIIAPTLKREIEMYRNYGFYTIKHTDGNIMPIIDQIVDCKPDALHSIDPQGHMNLAEVRRKYGSQIATIGNVNCGLLQSGDEEDVIADVKRCVDEGMEDGGAGFIFSTSNCVYTGMDLKRYELMMSCFRKYAKEKYGL